MRPLPIFAAALLLGACQARDDATQAGEARETAMPVEPDGGIGDGAGPPEDLAGDGVGDSDISDGEVLAGAIPTRFHGVWDYVGGTCDPASDMRMDIGPRSIGFYESRGNVAGVGQDGDDVLVDMAMEGEGEQWMQVTRLALSEDGERLEVSDGTKPKTKDEYPRKRCS